MLAECPPGTVSPYGKDFCGIIGPPECITDKDPAGRENTFDTPRHPLLD